MHSRFEPPSLRIARCWGSSLRLLHDSHDAPARQKFVNRASSLADVDVDQDDVESLCRRTKKMARLEAVLLVAEGALSTRKLAQFATLADTAEVRALIERLNAAYEAVHGAFRVERVATGYQLLTRPELSFWLDKIHHRQDELKLSSPALETLTIVAYHAPITRADVEAIRGVQCAEMLKQLMERGLVRISGEDDSLGRPYLYDTTRRFLELFGLRSLDDLPMADRLRHAKAGRYATSRSGPQEPGSESKPAGDVDASAEEVVKDTDDAIEQAA